MYRLKTVHYMALSNLAYIDFSNEDVNETIAKLGKKLKSDNNSLIELNDSLNAPLKEIANDWQLIAVQDNNTESGFYGLAFQNITSKEIVFSFRGTDISNNIIKTKNDFISDLQLAVSSANLGEPNQFREADEFVIATLQ